MSIIVKLHDTVLGFDVHHCTVCHTVLHYLDLRSFIIHFVIKMSLDPKSFQQYVRASNVNNNDNNRKVVFNLHDEKSLLFYLSTHNHSRRQSHQFAGYVTNEYYQKQKSSTSHSRNTTLIRFSRICHCLTSSSAYIVSSEQQAVPRLRLSISIKPTSTCRGFDNLYSKEMYFQI